jgi:hypothetical protein
MSDQGVRLSAVPLTSAQIQAAADPQYVRETQFYYKADAEF